MKTCSIDCFSHTSLPAIIDLCRIAFYTTQTAKRKNYGPRPSPRKLSTVTVAPKPAIKKKPQRHAYIGPPAATDGHSGVSASPMPTTSSAVVDTRAEPVDVNLPTHSGSSNATGNR